MDLTIGARVDYVLIPHTNRSAEVRLAATVVNITKKRVVIRLDKYPKSTRAVSPIAVVPPKES